MPKLVEDNRIETATISPSRTLWSVVREGTVIHSDQLDGHDPSGARAFETGLAWVKANCPGVEFHWRHGLTTAPREQQ